MHLYRIWQAFKSGFIFRFGKIEIRMCLSTTRSIETMAKQTKNNKKQNKNKTEQKHVLCLKISNTDYQTPFSFK